MGKYKTSDKIKNENLDDRKVKNKILSYLHNSGINLKTKHEYIVDENDLDNIRDNDYIVCPRISGTRTWIIFFAEKNNYYAINFPKHSQRKREDINIYPIEIPVIEDFYYGTIMEGIFFKFEERKFLVIDEVYQLYGETQLLKSKDDRLNNLSRKLTTDITFNPNYTMLVTQFYSTNKKSLGELYEKIKTDLKIQEITFYPKIYGKKIYTYTIIEDDLVDDVVKYGQFFIQKTAVSDVYHLLNVCSKEKMGIAYIPDMDTSKMCKQWFKSAKKKKELLVKCRMDNTKGKWVPIELIEDDIEDIDSD